MPTKKHVDKVALITGAGRGIGRAIAQRLARDGKAVIIADLDAGTAADAAQSIASQGGRAKSIAMDVTSEESVKEAITTARESFGPVSILVNNAGLFASTPALSETLEAWHTSLAVMLTGPLHCVRATAPDMIESGWGRIINISSVMAFTAYGEDVAYCTAKSGVLGLTHSLAMEFAKYGINVNAICPGHIRTPMLEATARHVEQRDGTAPGQFYKELAGGIPTRRIGEPEDIAKMVAFLCSDDADHITGQAMHVNGGSYLT